MDKFTHDAFEMAMKGSFDKEKISFKENIIDQNDHILRTVTLKLILEGKDPERMAESIETSEEMDTFASFVGSIMEVCFHIGYQSGRESMLEEAK